MDFEWCLRQRHTNSDTYAHAYPDSHTDTNAYSDTNAHPNTDTDTDTYPNTHTYADSDAYADSHALMLGFGMEFKRGLHRRPASGV